MKTLIEGRVDGEVEREEDKRGNELGGASSCLILGINQNYLSMQRFEEVSVMDGAAVMGLMSFLLFGVLLYAGHPYLQRTGWTQTKRHG